MIFQRALRRELFSAAGAVFTALFTIFITFMLVKILGEAAGGKVGSSDVLALIGFTSLIQMPVLLILTGYIAVLMVVTRSYQDSEMVVWFASGLSLTRWVKPVLMFGLPIIVATGFLSLVAAPWANRMSAEFRERFENRSDISKISPGKFQESASSDRIFFVEEVAGDLGKVQNVFINTLKNGRSSVVVAKEGKIDVDKNGDKFLIMTQGRRYDGLPTEPNFQMMQFEKYGVLVANQSKAAQSDKATKALTVSELLANPINVNRGELFWRISLPIMATILMLIAIPLGYVNPRVGRFANLIVALLAWVVYLNLVNVVQAWIVQGKFALNTSWWLVHLIALFGAAFLFTWRLTVNSRMHPSVLWCQFKRLCRQEKSAA